MKWIVRIGATLGILLAASHASAQPPEPEPAAPPTAAPPGAVPATQPSAGPPAPAVVVYDRGHQGTLFGDARYRSPGLAAALSLTPVPVDFGNFYAENVGWGLVYTTGQLALAGSMMWLGGTHMCHGRVDCSEWSDGETTAMVALASGYVAVKIVAAFHAASAAREFNATQPHVSVGAVPVPGGASGGVVVRF